MEMIWTDHKCCNITVLTVQNILGVTAYFLHGIILSTSVAVCFSEGSQTPSIYFFHAFLSIDICTQCFKIITQISFLYARNATSVCLQLPFLWLKFWPGCWHCCLVFGGSWVKLYLWDSCPDDVSWSASFPWDNSQGVTWNETSVTHLPFIIHNPLFDLSCTSITKWTIK
jgi:hypothetical protein